MNKGQISAFLGGALLLSGALVFQGTTSKAVAQSSYQPQCLGCGVPTLAASAGSGWNTLKLQAGTPYQFGAQETGAVVVSSSWKAVYGKITSSGVYTSPNFRLPYGEDRITYELVGGGSGELVITLESSPSVPSTTQARWLVPTGDLIESASGAQPEYDLRTEGTPAISFTGTYEDAVAFVGDFGLPIIEAGIAVPASIQTYDCAALVATMEEGELAYAIPEQLQPGTATAEGLEVKVSPQTPRAPVKCKRKPVYEDMSGDPCSTLTSPNGNGVYVKCGPVITEPGPIRESSGSVAVGAAVALDIFQQFGISVEADIEYPVTRIFTHFTQRQKCDRYTCKDGKLVYIGSADCFQKGYRYTSTPRWVVFADGHGTAWPAQVLHGWHCNIYDR